MVGHLTILAIVTFPIAAIVLALALKEKKYTEVKKYIAIGLFAAGADFVVEFIGTKLANWHYNYSIYMIGGLVPVELLICFFSVGVLLRFAFVNLSKQKAPVSSTVLLLFAIVCGFILYVKDLYAGVYTNVLLFTVPFGLWGLLNTKEKNRNWALLLAVLTAGIDFFFETFVLKRSWYMYADGFSPLISLAYGMDALGMIGLIERFNLLRIFGKK